MTIRAAFMGTPAFAVPTLAALRSVADVLAVFSQPDRPAGRGLKVVPTAVKQFAQGLDIPVLQPPSIRDVEVLNQLAALDLEVIVVVASGKILPKPILDLPRFGCINLHASLLPRWRGAAPVQWAIYHGDSETGVTLMRMDEGMDTGPMFSQLKTSIEPNERAQDVASRLADLGGQLVQRDLPHIVRNQLQPVPQNDLDATSAPLIKKQDGLVQWSRTALEIHNQIRAMSPWPSAQTFFGSKRVTLHRSHVLSDDIVAKAPGTLLRADSHGIEVACGKGVLALDELQMEGGVRLEAGVFVLGQRWKPEQQLRDTAA